jgi:hypothetical protein
MPTDGVRRFRVTYRPFIDSPETEFSEIVDAATAHGAFTQLQSDVWSRLRKTDFDPQKTPDIIRVEELAESELEERN